jgi:hypothetical protein
VIGLCKDSEHWVHPLLDLGYTPRLVEHVISLEARGGTVKPDVVAASNRLLNAITFDCKGGRNIDESQAAKYHDLSSSDLLRWINVPEPARLTRDTSFVSLEEKMVDRTDRFNEFPKLIFGLKTLRMTGKFSESQVNERLEKPIKLQDGMVPPTLYYPFSTTDDLSVILPFVLRALIETSVRLKRGGDRIVEDSTFDTESFRKSVHRMWDLMGDETRTALADKIRDVVRGVTKGYPQFIEKVNGSQGVKNIELTLSNLIPMCEKMLADEESKSRIEDYP